MGLARIKGIGPVAARAIMAGQPYVSFDDFRERIPKRSVDSGQVTALTSTGAFRELGISGGLGDSDEFALLGFTLKKPKVFKGIKPKHVRARKSETSYWVHDGLYRGAEMTEGRHSVSKLFWIPPFDKKDVLEFKASPFQSVKTYLLTAVDENGIGFHIMVNEDKEAESQVLRYVAAKCRGMVVCLDGFVRGPFLTDGPLGFRFFGVSGARFQSEPQVFPGSKTISSHIAALCKRR